MLKIYFAYIFGKIVECEYLLMGIQQLGDIFSIVHANLHAGLRVLAPGAK